VASSATAYSITATGSGNVLGFQYSIDQSGTQKTLAMATGWAGTNAIPAPCWLIKKGQSC